ncbi:MAG: glycosyltransferase family 4 protein [Planctomycetales bacterium]|nr:glycosyltransferase family 4 protein [Planctomycetales bacterium]
MKIAWYTPYSIDSAIGHYSNLVVSALRAQGTEVLVVRSENRTSDIRALPPTCRDESYAWAADLDRNPPAQLADYDLVVYNVGDHYDYHSYCFNHQAQVPGLTILHDFSLHHALYKYCMSAVPMVAGYREHLVAECGSEALDTYDRLVSDNNELQWWHHDMAKHPVYRWALEATSGVVTHAEFYRERVAATLGCPTTMIPLAYDSPLQDNATAGAAPATALGTAGKFRIVTIGAVNVNKRHETVIRALSASPLLRERCEFRVVGPIDDSARARLQQAQADSPQPIEMTILGRVDRVTLRQELEQADIISCLRFPALEGASASVIEGLLCQKPVIVCDTGCYHEIPDSAVYKIVLERELPDLIATLEDIVRRPQLAAQKAAHGRYWAAKRHAAPEYAQRLLEFAADVLYNRPVLNTFDRIADLLRQWDTPVDEVLMSRIDAAGNDLFRQRPSTTPTRRAA